MLRATERAYGLLIAIAFAGGLLGLAVGWIGFGANESRPFVDWWRPAGLFHPRGFFAVGMMQDGSYLGGAPGTVLAVVYQCRAARRAGALNGRAPGIGSPARSSAAPLADRVSSCYRCEV